MLSLPIPAALWNKNLRKVEEMVSADIMGTTLGLQWKMLTSQGMQQQLVLQMR
jgi:hypothetical protein